ncbi:LOW QUALITY PROTEIN: hypothetical protein PHMEG_00012726 [Phytophthora megakarya]|uniref:Reverse transcriptase n=1 Tax=Phytophthora megakarya TaxID=4795 RepID=A0A225WAM1_9STRA|nr:LOW QUALITY PROTEIN: hypothetical protein PHMEG_00012726 [Phytophthora megakarya]
MRDDIMLLPDLSDLTSDFDISKVAMGVPGRTTPTKEEQLRRILERHSKIFLGDGKAGPSPARRVMCEIDGRQTYSAPTKVNYPKVAMKVYELLKNLLETGLIEMSDSAGFSPIMMVLK